MGAPLKQEALVGASPRISREPRGKEFESHSIFTLRLFGHQRSLDNFDCDFGCH
jgi:hypothetical protein